MIQQRPFVLLAAISLVAIAVWPLSSVMPTAGALAARLSAAAAAIAASVACARLHHIRPGLFVAVSIVSGCAAAGLLWSHVTATDQCLADYDGRPALVGRDLRPEIVSYLAANPGLSSSDLLLDAGGDPARVWTAASISGCRFGVGWSGLLGCSMMALCVGSLLAIRRRWVPAAAATALPVTLSARPIVYDAFLSYRHSEPDRAYTTDLLESLESRGLRLAIDVRDFAPNQHFLTEMERCIKESRFVLCIITAKYLESDHTSEEAIISKTLDLADRRKRLVPLIFERVELPVWLHGLVGIDFTAAASVDPLERLATLLLSQRPQ